MIKLRGIIQDYAWGKGEESIICQQFGQKNTSNRYAEIWFGSHPNGDSLVNDSNTPLSQHLAANPELLGAKITERFGQHLPFLFKVLSVGQALSIQLHPDAEQAKVLHQADPKNYPDPYPKPEAGVAITPVKILYGFRPEKEIQNFISQDSQSFTPEVAEILGDKDLDYKSITEKILSLDSKKIQTHCTNLWERIENKNQPNKQPDEFEQEILKLKRLYPQGDRGVFFFYILNFVTLKPGDALFIDANIMHAYLEGELVEIMAPSDNVLRAGLTPKHIDLENTLKMTRFSESVPKLLRSNLNKFDLPNNPYFQLAKIENSVSAVNKTESLNLVFCLNGNARIRDSQEDISLKAGEAVLIGSETVEYNIDSKNSLVFIAKSTI